MYDLRFSMAISIYGALIALGFFAAYSITYLLTRKTEAISVVNLDRMLVWVLILAVIGARALFVLYHLDYFSLHPQEIVAVWHGGWVWHGGLLGGIIGVYAYCKRAGITFLSFLDILAPGVALGQAIGRWGNFFNQEAYGLPTNLPWAITIDQTRRLPGYESFVTFHPTFLYESAFDFLLFLFLGWLLLKRLDPGIRRDDKRGVAFFLYLLLYSLARFGIEFLRIDTVPVVAGLRAPQWISVGLIIIGAWGLTWVLHKEKKMVY